MPTRIPETRQIGLQWTTHQGYHEDHGRPTWRGLSVNVFHRPDRNADYLAIPFTDDTAKAVIDTSAPLSIFPHYVWRAMDRYKLRIFEDFNQLPEEFSWFRGSLRRCFSLGRGDFRTYPFTDAAYIGLVELRLLNLDIISSQTPPFVIPALFTNPEDAGRQQEEDNCVPVMLGAAWLIDAYPFLLNHRSKKHTTICQRLRGIRPPIAHNICLMHLDPQPGIRFKGSKIEEFDTMCDPHPML